MKTHQGNIDSRSKYRQERSNPAQCPNKGGNNPSFTVIFRALKKLCKRCRDQQGKWTVIREDGNPALHQIGYGFIRPFRRLHLRKGRVGAVLNQLLQMAGTENLININSAQSFLQLCNQTRIGNSLDIDISDICFTSSAQLYGADYHIGILAFSSQESRIGSQSFRKALFCAPDDTFCIGIGDAPVRPSTRIDNENFVISIQNQHHFPGHNKAHGFVQCFRFLDLSNGNNMIFHKIIGIFLPDHNPGLLQFR